MGILFMMFMLIAYVAWVLFLGLMGLGVILLLRYKKQHKRLGLPITCMVLSLPLLGLAIYVAVGTFQIFSQW